jgi:hypothetical protein
MRKYARPLNDTAYPQLALLLTKLGKLLLDSDGTNPSGPIQVMFRKVDTERMSGVNRIIQEIRLETYRGAGFG